KLAKGRVPCEARNLRLGDDVFTDEQFAAIESKDKPKEEPSAISTAIPARAQAFAKGRLLEKRLAGDGEGLGDTSRSGFDGSVIAILIRGRFYNDEIVNTLISYGHGQFGPGDRKNALVRVQRMRDELGMPEPTSSGAAKDWEVPSPATEDEWAEAQLS